MLVILTMIVHFVDVMKSSDKEMSEPDVIKRRNEDQTYFNVF